MADNINCTVYVGNLDEKVSDRVLYDILIQAGPVLDLYIPKDKETDKRKGYAFAQYETEEIAAYAVKLFSGLVTLYNKTLKFAISGQDKQSGNSPSLNSSHRPRSHSSSHNEMGVSSKSMKVPTSSRFSEHQGYSSQERVLPGVSVHHHNGYRSHSDHHNHEHSNGHRSHNGINNHEHSNGYRYHHEHEKHVHLNGYNSQSDNLNYNYSQRVSGTPLDSNLESRLGRYESHNPRNSTSYHGSY